jgi:hypothetical protein
VGEADGLGWDSESTHEQFAGQDLEPASVPWAGRGVAPASSVDVRLARIEALLEADLDRLGPAVVADSVAALEQRLDALARRVDQVTYALDDATATSDSTAALARIEARLDALSARFEEIATEPIPPDPNVVRLTRRVEEALARFDRTAVDRDL